MAADADATIVEDAVSAKNVLQRCVGDHHGMRVLRRQLTEVLRDAHVPQLSDVAVVDCIVSLVSQRRLRLVGPFPPLRALEGVPTRDTPANSAPPAPAARSAPPAARGAAVPGEPSFAPNVDAAALAATLTDAAKDGTPFCEECARAARAA